MRAVSAVEAFARGWTHMYTAGLPRHTRDRRREEIASDLWESRPTEAGAVPGTSSGLLVRMLMGMPADLLWRSGELRRARRMELMDLKVDRELDWKVRLITHTALIAGVAFFLSVSLGGKFVWAIVLPIAAAAIAIEVARLRRDKRAIGSTEIDLAGKRRRRAFTLVAIAALVAIAYLANSLVSPEVSDRYWYVFVTPLMIAITVGPVVLLMLGWTYLPRKEDETGSRPA